jgi:putative transposase
MAEDRMAVADAVRKAISDGDVDFLREGIRVLAQAVMEAEVSELSGLPHGERNPAERLTHRNGYRDRRWDTRVGTIELAVPRVRDGSYLPSLLDPRRRTERALLALVRALGIEGISKSEVSRMCAALDAEVERFRSRPLTDSAFPRVKAPGSAASPSPGAPRRPLSRGPRGRRTRRGAPRAGRARRGRG